MQFVEWCNLFFVGHQIIDKQHQVLIDIANRFHSETHKGFNKRTTIECLNELIHYAQEHFATEERVTKQFGYPEEQLVEHKATHEKLIIDIFQLNESIANKKIISMYQIEKFLTEWLVLHILTEDKKYTDYLTTMQIPINTQ